MILGRSIGSKLGKRITNVRSVAQTVAQTAAQVAKSQLDQVLTDVQHSERVKQSQELLQRIGQGVLDRAEAIREQIANTPLSPSWLKEVHIAGARRSDGYEGADETARSGNGHGHGNGHAHAARGKHGHSAGIHKPGSDEVPAEATSMTESTVSEAAEDMQPVPLKVVMGDEEASKQLGFEAIREIEEFTEEAGTIVETSDLPKPRSAGKSAKAAKGTRSKKSAAGGKSASAKGGSASKSGGMKARSSKAAKKS